MGEYPYVQVHTVWETDNVYSSPMTPTPNASLNQSNQRENSYLMHLIFSSQGYC